MNPLLIPLIVLAVVQGVTEFLPISSSGHLVLFEHFPPISRSLASPEGESMMFFNIMLHVASLIAILLFYSRDILRLVSGFFRSVLHKKYGSEEVLIVRNLAVATLPAFVIGFFLYHHLENLLFEPLWACSFLIINGFILIATKRIQQRNRQISEISLLGSLFTGLCQAFAILPGISRSGSTIAGGLLSGLRPTEAVRFSFYMAIPVVAGAGLAEGMNIANGNIHVSIAFPLVMAMIVCVVVALFSMRLLVVVARKLRLDLFGYYTIAAGIAGVFYFSLA